MKRAMAKVSAKVASLVLAPDTDEVKSIFSYFI